MTEHIESDVISLEQQTRLSTAKLNCKIMENPEIENKPQDKETTTGSPSRSTTITKSDNPETLRKASGIYKTLIPKERELRIQLEETALEVSKYFSEIRSKVNKFFLEQERKVHDELTRLTENEIKKVGEDFVECKEIVERLEKGLISDASRQEINSDINGMHSRLEEIKKWLPTPFELRFMINTELEDMMESCDLINIEVINARHQERSPQEQNSAEETASVGNEGNQTGSGHDPDDSDDEYSSESISESDSLDTDDDTAETESSEEVDGSNVIPTEVANIQSADSATGSNETEGHQTQIQQQQQQQQLPVRHRRRGDGTTSGIYGDEPPPPYPGYPTLESPAIPTIQTTSTSPRSHHVRSVSASSGLAVPQNISRSLSNPNISAAENTYPQGNAAAHSAKNDSSQKSIPDSLTPVDNIHPSLRLPTSAHSFPSAPPLSPRAENAEQRHRSFVYSPSSRWVHEPRPHTTLSNETGLNRDHSNISSNPVPSRSSSSRHSERRRTLPFTIKLRSQVNLASAFENRSPNVVGMAIMGECFVVVDRWNFKVKLIKGSEIKSALFFGTMEPWDVTSMNETKCAVVVPEASEICLVSVHNYKLKLGKRVSTARGYTCIAHWRKENKFLCGCCQPYGLPHVALVNIDGEVLRLITKDPQGVDLFLYPRVIRITPNDTIVVTDSKKNVVIFMNSDLAVINIYKGSRSSPLRQAQGTATHPVRRYVVVADMRSNTLHILRSNGELIGCIADIINPKRLAIQGLNKLQLLVAHNNGYVSRYDME